MIDRIIDWSVRNKFLVLLVVAAAALAGAHALRNVPLDAIPDVGDTQVIVYSRWDRSPDLIEAQVTYPIVTAMLGAPHVRAVRGVSDFGYSFVYVIFEDGTDTYWARTRTLEYLSGVLSRLPPDSRTELGPDATGLGWVFQYALVDRGNGHFEPRLVETGWRRGDEVEVTKGLEPGERIVVAGTFFVDSESRMKAKP